MVRPGRNSATLQGFFDQLGDRKDTIRAVSIDMSGEYQRAIRRAVPQAEICFDPFHVVRLGARATDQVRRDEWNAHERSHTQAGRWVKGTRWSRDFEDTVAWLAQQMAFTPITRLLRIGWATVGRIVQRVVADHLDENRLAGLVCIGVDEISYRRHHRYLTSVADHAAGAIEWCARGPQQRHSAALLRRARRPQGTRSRRSRST